MNNFFLALRSVRLNIANRTSVNVVCVAMATYERTPLRGRKNLFLNLTAFINGL